VATQTVHIPAGEARVVETRVGSRVSIVCPLGEQVADLIGFCLQDPAEYLSVSHTRNMLWRLYLRVGDFLVSNRREPLLEILRDDVGKHDLLCVACDEKRYSLDYGISGHRSCAENFRTVLQERAWPTTWLPDPINVFQNAPIDRDLTQAILPSVAKPGDRLVLRAMKELLLVVSACPQDQAATNGYVPKPIDLIVE